MTNAQRGFRFVLESPRLQAGWHLESARRAVATALQALQQSREQLDTLLQRRSEGMAQCAAVPGDRVDPQLRELQLRGLAIVEARLAEARRIRDERHGDWVAAIEHCARRQQRVDGLDEVRVQQQAAFELEQRREQARRIDDDWLMRTRASVPAKEAP